VSLPWEKVTDYRDYFLGFLRFVFSEGLGKTNGGKQGEMGKARGWGQGMVERVALGAGGAGGAQRSPAVILYYQLMCECR
jgi:hypothetical protein